MTVYMEKGNIGEIVVKFEYTPDKVVKIKTIGGRRWDAANKAWIVKESKSAIQRLLMAFSNEEIISDVPEINSIINHIKSVTNALEEELKLCGYSPNTIIAYVGHVRRFALFSMRNVDELGNEQIRKYLLYLLDNQARSHSYVNQALSAIKFLFQSVLINNNVKLRVPRPKKQNKLPDVLSQQEVGKILSAVTNPKHRAILFLTYSAGLRVSEVVALRLEDIDFQRMLINVRQGKGRKDRYTVLSEMIQELLQGYLKSFQLKDWLFPGEGNEGHLTERSVQKVFNRALETARINKDVSIHSLRHSFATHLLEGGTDLRYIQELLGHKSSKTTEIYTHVTKRDIQRIRSPIDSIKFLDK